MKRLLLLPLLAPLAVAFCLGMLNLANPVALRLLVWRTPALPLGLWVMVAAAGGGSLGSLAMALLLSPSDVPLRRRLRRPASEWSLRDDPPHAEAGGDRRPEDGEDWRRQGDGESEQDEVPWGEQGAAMAWGPPPERNPDAPRPTMDVPFRVVQRGSTAPASGDGVAEGAAHGWDGAADDSW